MLLALQAEQHIHGVVLDSVTGTPIRGAVVHVLSTQAGGITDHHGRFHLHLTPSRTAGDSVELAVRSIGYGSDTIRCAIADDITLRLQPTDVLLGGVSVVGDRLATSSGTMPENNLSVQDVTERRGQTLADLLTTIPGVTALRTGASVAKPVVRGVTGMRVTVTNAGVSQQGQQWADDHGPEIDPFTPMSVSLLNGAAGIEYGAGAMAGVINIEPPPIAPTSVPHGTIHMNFFGNNVQGSAGGWIEQDSLFSKLISARVFGGFRKAGYVRTPEYALNNTGYEQYSAGIYSVVGTQHRGPSLKLFMSAFGANIGIFSGSHLGSAEDLQHAMESDTPLVAASDVYGITSPMQKVGHLLFSARGSLPIPNVGNLNLTYGWQQNNRNEFDAHNARIVGNGPDSASRAADSVSKLQSALATPAVSLRLTTYSLAAHLHHNTISGLTGSVGIDAMRQVNSRGGTVLLIPDYVLMGTGLYARESFMVNSLLVDVGLRYDVRWLDVFGQTQESDQKIEHTYGSISGAVGVRWEHNYALTSLFNVGLAWRQPQVNELYSDGVHHGAARYEIGNPNLHKEQIVNIDYTARYTTGSLSAAVTIYANYYLGFIQALADPAHPTVTIRGVFPTYRYAQTDALISGADVNVEWRCTPVVSVLAQGSALLGDDMVADTPLFLMPPPSGRVALHAHGQDVLGFEDAFAEAGVKIVAHQWRYTPGSDYVSPPSGYALADIQAGGSFLLFGNSTSLSLTVYNLFNKEYRDYLSRYRYYANDAGRDVVLRISIPFGGVQ